MLEKQQVLIATLGEQPLVIPCTLNLLLQAGYPISQVIAIHPYAPPQSRLRHALETLQAQFTDAGSVFAQRGIHFQSHVMERDGQPIQDILERSDIDGTLTTIHRLLSDLKHRGYHIHLSVSGGLRMMALLAIPLATLNFDRHDHVWDITHPEEDSKRTAHEGSIMPATAGRRLIEVPSIALGPYISSPIQSFHIAQQEQRRDAEAQEDAHCKQVVEQSTPTQLKVLRALARGLHPKEVAREREIALATVNAHATSLYAYCRAVWNIPEKEQLTYHFFQAKFGNFFAEAGRTVEHERPELD